MDRQKILLHHLLSKTVFIPHEKSIPIASTCPIGSPSVNPIVSHKSYLSGT